MGDRDAFCEEIPLCASKMSCDAALWDTLTNQWTDLAAQHLKCSYGHS